MATPVVTFDVGQTLVDLDLDFLAARLAERGLTVTERELTAAAPAAWQHYDELVDRGAGHPWKPFMARLLAGAGVAEVAPVVDWLYGEQARKNLWRRRIEPMIDLVRELSARGVAVAVLSNSEGHLRELLDEIALSPLFGAIVDSGTLPFAKPDPRIFAHALAELGIGDAHAVHVGDSWAADIVGALAAGWGAIWYRSRSSAATGDPRVPVARDAAETRAALATLGI